MLHSSAKVAYSLASKQRTGPGGTSDGHAGCRLMSNCRRQEQKDQAHTKQMIHAQPHMSMPCSHLQARSELASHHAEYSMCVLLFMAERKLGQFGQ